MMPTRPASGCAPDQAVFRDRLDDAQVAHRAVAEGRQGGLVGGALVGRHRGVDAGELDQRGPLDRARLEGRRRQAAGEEPPAGRSHRRSGQLDVRGELVGVADRAERVDPVGHGHVPMLPSALPDWDAARRQRASPRSPSEARDGTPDEG